MVHVGLDVLVSNAGIFSRGSGPFRQESETAAKELFDVNYFAGAALAKDAIPHLEKTRGNIVFTCSVASQVRENYNARYSSRCDCDQHGQVYLVAPR